MHCLFHSPRFGQHINVSWRVVYKFWKFVLCIFRFPLLSWVLCMCKRWPQHMGHKYGQLISFLLWQTYIKQMLVGRSEERSSMTRKEERGNSLEAQNLISRFEYLVRGNYKISVNHVWYGYCDTVEKEHGLCWNSLQYLDYIILLSLDAEYTLLFSP
jgi:hypothetical protein